MEQMGQGKELLEMLLEGTFPELVLSLSNSSHPSQLIVK